ncbi:MAG: hypothetical protein BGN88_14690 [Clostridiales bacterium 43-6]|nr:MAG: hypothetical protein BGN88_14690 [Clostridiales bacterium 43-6]
MGSFKNPAGVVTGVYGDDNMNDEICWAAAELYRTTGESKYLQKFKTQNAKSFNKADFGSYDVGGFATVALLQSQCSDTALINQLKASLTTAADTILNRVNNNAYKVSLSNTDYRWGSNMVLTNYAICLIMAGKYGNTTVYDSAALEQLNYLFGRNYNAKCYVSGFGTNPMMNPHHRPSQADGITAPVPGMVAGGPDDRLEDATMKQYFITKPSAPASAYLDNPWSYSTNEITIYWNSSAFFVTGYFTSK